MTLAARVLLGVISLLILPFDWALYGLDAVVQWWRARQLAQRKDYI